MYYAKPNDKDKNVWNDANSDTNSWENPYAADFRIKNNNFMVCDISGKV